MYDARPIPDNMVRTTPKTSLRVSNESEKNSIMPQMTVIIPMNRDRGFLF